MPSLLTTSSPRPSVGNLLVSSNLSLCLKTLSTFVLQIHDSLSYFATSWSSLFSIKPLFSRFARSDGSIPLEVSEFAWEPRRALTNSRVLFFFTFRSRSRHFCYGSSTYVPMVPNNASLASDGSEPFHPFSPQPLDCRGVLAAVPLHRRLIFLFCAL